MKKISKTTDLEQLKEIMEHPSYKIADKDTDFLYSDDARAVRLQLDYLKAELIMRKNAIDHTVVVFGSARIIEFEDAMASLKKIEDQLQTAPDSEALLYALKRAESMVQKSTYYEEARKLGQLIGKSGKDPEDCHVTLMTGGGPGIMEAANRGAKDVGAKSIGLNIQLPHEQFPNPYITPELCFQFHYYAIRKLHFLQRARALVIFPGGFGTLDELFEVLTIIQSEKSKIIPIVLVGKSYWQKAIDFKFLEEEGVIGPEDNALFSYVDTAEEAWQTILQWHEEHGTPLF
jgi:uncharacterized protein (TIGR00730 family)